ncbi:hypothetical protein A1O3_08900 [Capronia epimyces CBS 606.96]|uniref:AB hydrolase-1 domain-containing protein n=1 Tax=Capronia epimyces CBS 606.96 TaxID=1182542 RepID=W9XGR1_9EURO|nr:uncharacterized protein A1O3_08900 [Capronia epimyces CBS 606.96]EXJ79398.1 hypothetical protein A1O3_08900 [Capronia epimyces CBS 606.96]
MLAQSSTSHRHLTQAGTDIHFLSSGEHQQQGRLAVLLHGLGGSTETFRELLPFIPPNYQVINVDVEGFGKTPLNQEGKPLSFARYVSDLHDLITHVQESGSASTSSSTSTAGTATATATTAINGNSSSSNRSQEPVLLVGHSLGGIISLHYAAQYPTQVAGLLLLGPGRSLKSIPPAQKGMQALARTAREQGMDAVAQMALQSNFPADRDNEPAHVQQVRDAVASSDAEAYASTAEAIASDDHHDPDYSRIRCPVVFVAGDKDKISPVQRSEDISALLGGPAEVVVVKSGHQPILQDLEGVTKAFDKLLAMV